MGVRCDGLGDVARLTILRCPGVIHAGEEEMRRSRAPPLMRKGLLLLSLLLWFLVSRASEGFDRLLRYLLRVDIYSTRGPACAGRPRFVPYGWIDAPLLLDKAKERVDDMLSTQDP